MPAPLILRIIGDATSYFKTAESTIATNTKISESFTRIGPAASLSADAQVAAAVKGMRAQEQQLTALKAVQAQAIAGSRERIAADVAVAEAEMKLNRAMGISTVGIGRTGAASKETERDFGKLTRGALAGSGVFSALGRSLAFASGGFLAVAGGAALISNSIKAALDLASTQRQVDQQLKVSGKSWEQYGKQIDAADLKLLHVSGFTDVELLQSFTTLFRATGSVTESLHLNAVAADVARGRHIGLAAAGNALAKAANGSFAALRRLNIIVPQGSTTMEALAFVQQKYAGQAEAGTTAADRFRASLIHTEDIVGTALLPTFDRLVRHLGDWIAKANETGRIQRDVNEVVSVSGDVFHTLETVVGAVDKVTGSFAKTLELILALRVASTLATWITNVRGLAAAWGGVTVAAGEAAAAERVAAGGAIVGGAAGGAGVAARIGMYTGAGAGAAGLIAKKPILGALGLGAGWAFAQQGETGSVEYTIMDGSKWYRSSYGGKPIGPWTRLGPASYDGVPIPSNFGQLPPVLGGPSTSSNTRSRLPGFTGGTPFRDVHVFQLNYQEQLAQAQAALTTSTTDDVSAAKGVIARIKRLMSQDRLHGKALIQALGAEAAAISTIQSAQAAAAQKRAAAAQAAEAKIQAQIQDSIDPLKLEVALSRAQALGKPLAAILKKIRASAQKALDSGKLSLEQQKQAWDEIASINQQLADSSKAATHQFRLASTRALTAGLHLTDEQRKALRARLSQLGPGGHIPDSGVGAYGYEIGHNGRPLHVHTTVTLDGKKVAQSTTKHQQRGRRRSSSQRRGPNAGDW